MLVELLWRIFFCSKMGSILLFIAAIAAIVMNNSSANVLYNNIINFSMQRGSNISVQSIVNNFLMAVFFLKIGLEVKYELLRGNLNSFSRIALPAVAALGGMVVPVVIYILFTINNPEFLSGWAIPSATDIAFAVSVLSLLEDRVPTNLRIFLLALAIFDDLGAIIIIALFYNDLLNFVALVALGSTLGVIAFMNYINIRSIVLYLFSGIILWGCTFFSGIHATLSGIMLAGFIPVILPEISLSPANNLRQRLQLWVDYLVLPLFSFVNAGVSLRGISLIDLISLFPLGILVGLVAGKPIGIMLFTTIALKFRFVRLPDDVTFYHIAAISVLCGIGFTMSIFIAHLAFIEENLKAITLAKVGIFSGSIISAVLGILFLRSVLPLSKYSRILKETGKI